MTTRADAVKAEEELFSAFFVWMGLDEETATPQECSDVLMNLARTAEKVAGIWREVDREETE
jgi:hypothetical protein